MKNSNFILFDGGIVSLLTKLQGLWGGSKRPAEGPLLSFAVVPAAKLVQREYPFNDWRAPDVDVPEEWESNFIGCVWMYQMFVFYLFVEERFDSDTANMVLEYQVSFLDAMTAGSGNQMKEGVEKIKGIVVANLQTPEMDVDGKKVAVPLEYAIAYSFFPDITWDSATALVLCLEHGKCSARKIFEPFIQATQIKDGNVIVQPATP